MSRRSVTRAVCAPVVIAIAATVLSPAIISISSDTQSVLARFDRWMSSVSLTVISALPGAPGERTVRSIDMPPIVEALRLPADDPVIIAEPAPALLAPAASEAEIKQPAAPEPPQQLASVNPVEKAPEVAPVEIVPAAAEKMPEPSAAIMLPTAPETMPEAAPVEISPAAVAAVTPEKIPEVAVLAPAPVAPEPVLEAAPVVPAPAASEKIPDVVVATVPAAPETVAVPEIKPEPSIEITATIEPEAVAIAKTEPVREKTPAPVAEIQPREERAEENQVFAALSLPQTATDTTPMASAQPAADVKFDLPSQAAPAETSPGRHSAVDPIQMTNIPMSAPLKIRALTRADIPSAERLASLGPMRKDDARNLPPELGREAYDAPAATETPMSIGRRRWQEEAAKYQGLGSPEALLEALKHVGAGAKALGLPPSLWCADFMNLVLRKSGLNATGSRAAKSYLQYGKQIEEPRVGAIAIFTRGKNGGHVGIVRGTDGNGNPIIVSGNYNNRVAEAVYPKARVIAYVVAR